MPIRNSATGEPRKQSLWRHRTRGSKYVIAGVGTAQCSRGTISEGDRVVVYRAADGTTWVRKVEEFTDGRFERIVRRKSRGKVDG
jgi:hypothetical protein